jgi:hypothetical protein
LSMPCYAGDGCEVGLVAGRLVEVGRGPTGPAAGGVRRAGALPALVPRGVAAGADVGRVMLAGGSVGRGRLGGGLGPSTTGLGAGLGLSIKGFGLVLSVARG